VLVLFLAAGASTPLGFGLPSLSGLSIFSCWFAQWHSFVLDREIILQQLSVFLWVKITFFTSIFVNAMMEFRVRSQVCTWSCAQLDSLHSLLHEEQCL
jgi:hypothetical protein